MTENQDFLTVEEAAVRASVSPSTIRNWLREGKLTRYRHTNRVYNRVDPAEVDVIVAARAEQYPGKPVDGAQ